MLIFCEKFDFLKKILYNIYRKLREVIVIKNILSYQPGTLFTGAEIKAWVKEQLENHTSHERLAHYMTHFSKMKDDRLYFISIEHSYVSHWNKRQARPKVYRAI